MQAGYCSDDCLYSLLAVHTVHTLACAWFEAQEWQCRQYGAEQVIPDTPITTLPS